MTVSEAYIYMREHWREFVEELIEENLVFLLEYEDLDEDEIELYTSFEELPIYLKEAVWQRQEEHIQNEFDDYANWYAGKKSGETI